MGMEGAAADARRGCVLDGTHVKHRRMQLDEFRPAHDADTAVPLHGSIIMGRCSSLDTYRSAHAEAQLWPCGPHI
jgi:hypothetical protein